MKRSEHACPRDKSKLHISAIGDRFGEECQTCGGVWLKRTSFGSIIGEQVVEPTPSKPTRRAPFDNEVRYLPCPACNAIMTRKNFEGISGIIIDVCPKHGVWLDRHELFAIACFLRENGAERAQAACHVEESRIARKRGELKNAGDIQPACDLRPIIEILFED